MFPSGFKVTSLHYIITLHHKVLEAANDCKNNDVRYGDYITIYGTLPVMIYRWIDGFNKPAILIYINGILTRY